MEMIETQGMDRLKEFLRHHGYKEISHGTLRAVDLLQSYADELTHLSDDPDHYALASAAYIAVGRLGDDVESEEDLFLMDELCDALDSLAPEGYYFGVCEGDGSSFGFWKVEES